MSAANYHLDDIPDGFQIFEERLSVAGLAHRREAAADFVRGRELSLDFERETGNAYDANAIRVIGCKKWLFGTKRYFIGYIPANVSKLIVEGGYFERIRPRLLKTWMGDTGYVEVLFQILGPKGERYKFLQVDPAFLSQSRLGKDLHYIDFINQVKHLKKQSRLDEAIDLPLNLVAQIEKEAQQEGGGVPTWYYEQLAVIYRKQKRLHDEIAILERYLDHQKGAVLPNDSLAVRLQKARTLLAKHGA